MVLTVSPSSLSMFVSMTTTCAPLQGSSKKQQSHRPCVQHKPEKVEKNLHHCLSPSSTVVETEKVKCGLEAKQIEIDVVSLSTRHFAMQISAPNGENSPMLNFENYGQTHYFSPQNSGCGHGNWKCDMFYIADDNRPVLLHSEKIYLDGVGSLFFSVGDDLRPHLNSQEFLRLPTLASRCLVKCDENEKNF